MSESNRGSQDDPFASPQGEQAGSSYPPPTAYPGSGGGTAAPYDPGSSWSGSGPGSQEFGATGYDQPAYPQTAYPQAAYPQPGYPQPTYGGPGYGQQQAYGYPPPVIAPTNGLAIAALVTSILGFGIIAVICGHIARRQIRERQESGDGLALAGLIIGYITVAFWVAIILFIVVIAAAGATSGGSF